jgi:hypothetical protein
MKTLLHGLAFCWLTITLKAQSPDLDGVKVSLNRHGGPLNLDKCCLEFDAPTKIDAVLEKLLAKLR